MGVVTQRSPTPVRVPRLVRSSPPQLPHSTAWPPSCARLSEQQVATMDTVRDLSSALWSLRTSQEAARLLRTSLSLLRCFLFFDICYLIGGITLISMALSNQVKDQDNRMVFAGGLLTLFGSLSAMCNSLASHGLRTWRRAFLLPWLLLFLLVLAFLFLHLAQVFYQYHLRLKWEHLFLFLATYCLFSCWRHIHKQYLVMAFPRPEQVVVDVESVVRGYLRLATAHSPPEDLPPKYEEVQAAAAQVSEEEAPPPKYDESMTMGSNLASTNSNLSSTNSNLASSTSNLS